MGRKKTKLIKREDKTSEERRKYIGKKGRNLGENPEKFE